MPECVKKLLACAANSFGVLYSKLLCSRSSLYSFRHAAIFRFAAAKRFPVRLGQPTRHSPSAVRVRIPVRLAPGSRSDWPSSARYVAPPDTATADRHSRVAPGSAQALFQQHVASLIHRAVPAGTISQIYPDRQLLMGNNPALLRRCDGNLPHCQSPSICALSMPITWERTGIPLEDRSSHPICLRGRRNRNVLMEFFKRQYHARLLLQSNDSRATQDLFSCMARSSHLLRGCVLDGTLQLRVGIAPSRSSNSDARRTRAVEYSVMVWRTPIGEWKEVLFLLTYRREWIPERNCWRDIVVRQERYEQC